MKKLSRLPDGQHPSGEVFLFHGPPGNDEHVLRLSCNALGGSSGPSNRQATRERAITKATARNVDSNTLTIVTASDSGSLDPFTTLVGSSNTMGETMVGQLTAMQQQAGAAERSTNAKDRHATAKEKLAYLEALTLQLQIFEPSSVEYLEARSRLAALSK